MLLQEFLSRKKLSRKYRSIFGLKSWSCDWRQMGFFPSAAQFLPKCAHGLPWA